MPGRPFGQAGAFQKYNVFLAHAGQVISNGTSDDAPPDDKVFGRMPCHISNPGPDPCPDHRAGST